MTLIDVAATRAMRGCNRYTSLRLTEQRPSYVACSADGGIHMTRRLIPACALIVASALFASAAARGDHGSTGLTVHEWGTFTAVAGEDGRPVQWMALSGPSDLPCFVKRAPNLPDKSRLW